MDFSTKHSLWPKNDSKRYLSTCFEAPADIPGAPQAAHQRWLPWITKVNQTGIWNQRMSGCMSSSNVLHRLPDSLL
jgi:hypothetical protein